MFIFMRKIYVSTGSIWCWCHKSAAMIYRSHELIIHDSQQSAFVINFSLSPSAHPHIKLNFSIIIQDVFSSSQRRFPFASFFFRNGKRETSQCSRGWQTNYEAVRRSREIRDTMQIFNINAWIFAFAEIVSVKRFVRALEENWAICTWNLRESDFAFNPRLGIYCHLYATHMWCLPILR